MLSSTALLPPLLLPALACTRLAACRCSRLQDQTQSDAVLDDLSCMLGCTRTSLHGAGAAAHSLAAFALLCCSLLVPVTMLLGSVLTAVLGRCTLHAPPCTRARALDRKSVV